MMRIALALGVAVAIAAFPLPEAESATPAFACPFSLRDVTPELRARIEAALPAGDPLEDPVRLNASIDMLKGDGLSKAMIINHLIGAYCPSVADTATLSDAQKAAAIRRFATKVTLLVYDYEDEKEIILDVPLKPTLVDEVHFRAQQEGLSVDSWFQKTIQQALGRKPN